MDKEINAATKIFTRDDLLLWDEKYHSGYLLDILNEEVSIETAREDLFSLIGTKYDYRVPNICDTAPYPECNGANGCDTCEHQEESE